MAHLVLVELMFGALFVAGTLAVTKDDIYNEANGHVGSTHWRKTDTYKCNIFVDDVLANAGATRPKRYFFWYSPIGANEWGNPNSYYVTRTECYNHISSSSDRQRGDVIAFPNPRGLGHVGIVSDGNQYISAGNETVDEKAIPFHKTHTIWRYKYTDC